MGVLEAEEGPPRGSEETNKNICTWCLHRGLRNEPGPYILVSLVINLTSYPEQAPTSQYYTST